MVEAKVYTEASVYRTFAGDPYYNMAFDEWMLAQSIERPGSVFVRLYSWSPGAISFGFNQRQNRALDFDHAGTTPIIRRITGGRALYHDPGELTYSIAANTDQLGSSALAGTLSESSQAIAAALTAFLHREGIAATVSERGNEGARSTEFMRAAPCFASTGSWEVEVETAKVIASAQRRFGNSFLQHGSIKLAGLVAHPALEGMVIPGATSTNRPGFDRTGFNSLADSFIREVGPALGLRFVSAEASEQESGQILQRVHLVHKNCLGRRDIH